MHDENQPPETVESLESNLEAFFPRALYWELRNHFQSPGVRGNEWVTRLPPGLDTVFFRASIEGYSSALLAVDVGGAKELAEVLKGNLDTFTMLMEAFVPAAFASVIPSSYFRNEFVASIAPTAELSRTFAEVRARQGGITHQEVGRSEAAVGETNKGGWLEKAPRALVATAFSLLTPVALSLIVLYAAAQMLMQDRAELAKREAALISQEQDLHKTELSATAEFRKENIELLHLLLTPQNADLPKH